MISLLNGGTLSTLQASLAYLAEMIDVSVEYEYEGKNISTETVFDKLTPRSTLKRTEYTYNVDNLLQIETVIKGGITVVKTFQYDAEGNLTAVDITKSYKEGQNGL